jgi:hypothetical protein
MFNAYPAADGTNDVRLTFVNNGLTQAPHVDVHGTRFHVGSRTADFFNDLLVREDAVRMLHQEPEQPKFCRAKVDVPAIARYPKGR